MLKSILFLAISVVTVYGTGEFNLLHSSGSAKFSGHEQLDQSLLKEVFAACLGFTINKGSDWPGLSTSHPFNFPEAVVVVAVDGISSLGLKDGITYPMNTDEDESYTYQALHNDIMMRYPGQNATLLRMDMAEAGTDKPYSHFFGDYDDTLPNWTVKHLLPSVSEDKQFLQEMAVLQSIAKLMGAGMVYRDGVPDVYWVSVRCLHPVLDLHGRDSPAAEEAINVLIDTIKMLNESVCKAYNNEVVVAAMCSDVSHTRRTRSLMAEADGSQPDLNLAPEYSSDYPVIFNIILWFGVVFVFSLLAISLFIADMDPGRDSIIYRMTSTRMKKDN